MVAKLCCTHGQRRTGPLSGFMISEAHGRTQAAE
jgi:hypothetical protein